MHTCLCFVSVTSGFLGRFLVQPPSLAWLIQGKSRFVCTGEGESESSRGRTRGYRAGGYGAILGRFLGPCSPDNFCSPLSILPPSPHTKGSWAALRGSPQTFFNSAKTGPLPPGEAPALGGEGQSLSCSGLPQSIGRGVGPRQAEWRWAGAQSGAFGWGSPLKFKKRSNRVMENSMARPGIGFSHLWVGNLHVPLCTPACALFQSPVVS